MILGLLQGFHSLEQSLGAVGLFPGHTQVLPAEVAVGGQLAVDGTTQVQHVDGLKKSKVSGPLDTLFNLFQG